jgi:hypothetical protein
VLDQTEFEASFHAHLEHAFTRASDPEDSCHNMPPDQILRIIFTAAQWIETARSALPESNQKSASGMAALLYTVLAATLYDYAHYSEILAQGQKAGLTTEARPGMTEAANYFQEAGIFMPGNTLPTITTN